MSSRRSDGESPSYVRAFARATLKQFPAAAWPLDFVEDVHAHESDRELGRLRREMAEVLANLPRDRVAVTDLDGLSAFRWVVDLHHLQGLLRAPPALLSDVERAATTLMNLGLYGLAKHLYHEVLNELARPIGTPTTYAPLADDERVRLQFRANMYLIWIADYQDDFGYVRVHTRYATRAAGELGMSYVAGVEHRAGRAMLARGVRWHDDGFIRHGSALIDAGARHAVDPNIFMWIWSYRAAEARQSRDASRRWREVLERLPGEAAGTVPSHVNLLQGLRESDVEAVELARDGFAQHGYLKGVHDSALWAARMRIAENGMAARHRACENATLAYLIAERLGLPTAAPIGRWLHAFLLEHPHIATSAIEASLQGTYPTLFARYSFRLPSGLEFSDVPPAWFPGPPR